MFAVKSFRVFTYNISSDMVSKENKEMGIAFSLSVAYGYFLDWHIMLNEGFAYFVQLTVI